MCDRIRQPSARERALVKRLKVADIALLRIIEMDEHPPYCDYAGNIDHCNCHVSVPRAAFASFSNPLP